MKLMVFDVGGTEIKYALMDEDLKICDRGYVSTPKNSFDEFADQIYEIYIKHKDEADGIAMSLPGFVDSEKGRVNGGGALRYNQRTEVGPLLEEKCGCKVVLINDGKAAAEAEFAKGSLIGCQNGAVFVIGTGVGGGLIVNGEVVMGKHFSAGEFSFITVDQNHFGQADSCLGNICSALAMLRKYEEKTGEVIDGREFFKRLESDDKAKEALDEFSEDVAKEIYNLYWLLDLEKIAIGGGISKQRILVDKIREKFHLILNDCFIPYFKNIINIEIVPATFGNDANLIGAFIAYLRRGDKDV